MKVVLLPGQLRREQASRRQILERQKGRCCSVQLEQGRRRETWERGRTRAECATGQYFQTGAYRWQTGRGTQVAVASGQRGAQGGYGGKNLLVEVSRGLESTTEKVRGECIPSGQTNK